MPSDISFPTVTITSAFVVYQIQILPSSDRNANARPVVVLTDTIEATASNADDNVGGLHSLRERDCFHKAGFGLVA